MKTREKIGAATIRKRTRPLPAPATIAPEVELSHEQLVVRRGERSGAHVIVAIHSTVLGPALGGVRMWPYAAPLDGVFDALRLAGGMTDKAAAAGLDLGGGKGVICAPPGNGALGGEQRRGMLLDFADLVEWLGGRYITAEDVGTSTDDMVAISERTGHVTGLPEGGGGTGDPSPFTAMGVEAAIRACVGHLRRSTDLDGVEVAVVGLGHVGSHLAMRLSAAGAQLSVSDVNQEKRELANRLGARWLEPAEALEAPCDVLAPCALGGVVNSRTLGSLRTEIVCGAANNQLADEGFAVKLAARGILYAPDFIANAGGLMNVYRELHSQDEAWTRERAMGIEATMAKILATADARELTPLAAAREVARERLDAAVRD